MRQKRNFLSGAKISSPICLTMWTVNRTGANVADDISLYAFLTVPRNIRDVSLFSNPAFSDETDDQP